MKEWSGEWLGGPNLAQLAAASRVLVQGELGTITLAVQRVVRRSTLVDDAEEKGMLSLGLLSEEILA